MCAVKAHSKISSEDCVRAFCKTEIFPFNRNFARRFQSPAETMDLTEDVSQISLEWRTSNLAKNIFEEEVYISRGIQRLTILLQNSGTTNNILMSLGFTSSSSGSTAAFSNRKALYCGTSAQYITHEKAIRKRREEMSAKNTALQLKEQQNQTRLRTMQQRKVAREEAQRQKKVEKERRAAEAAMRKENRQSV